jgi:hypothetical protein
MSDLSNAKIRAKAIHSSIINIMNGHPNAMKAEQLHGDNGRYIELMAQYAHWQSIANLIDERDSLKKQVERLTRAGDLMCRMADNEIINRHWKSTKKACL